MHLSPGTRIGPYEIVSPLGAGGMGEVFRARDTRLGREVAIKSLPAALARDPDRLARFELEARTLASLSHPNIAAIHGLEEREGVPHLVLELVEGETLAARLARGAMPPREALALGIQVASAVEAAHERGVVHRDLKPGNVMLTASGLAKVLDFGLAKVDAVAASGADLTQSPTIPAHAGATVAGTLLGTAAYMSPEQARGQAVDRRSDVWSFGCVLYECLTGRPAFAGATVSDLIARILEREPDWSALPAAAPPRLRETLRRCLRREAADRPRDIRDVRLELESLAAPERRDEDHERSIAVLPFENLSGADDEYFADGVTDEILNALAQLKGLRVAARSSCFAFKGRRETPRAVGEQLDVATVLEGTVRRSGARLRITAQLVDAGTGYQVWSERYDRQLDDVFDVQDEIAAAIAAKLRGAIADESGRARAKPGTRSVEAYELFLKGRALQYQRGSSVLAAIDCFERAIALDPGYADALAWLADSYRLLGTYGIRPASEVMPRSQQAAERALEIDPDSTEALATLADIEIQYHHDQVRAEALWHRALELDPRYVRARCERAHWLLGSGFISFEQALEEVSRAAEDEPLNAWVASMRSFILSYFKRHEQARAEAARALDLSPDSFIARLCVMQSAAFAGDHAAAVRMAPTLLAHSNRHPWPLSLLGTSLAELGEHDRAAAVFEELEARSRHEFVPPSWIAVSAVAAGRVDEALRFALRAFDERDPAIQLPVNAALGKVAAIPDVRRRLDALWGPARTSRGGAGSGAAGNSGRDLGPTRQ